MNIILICLAIKYNGDWDRIYQALEDKEKVTIEQMQEVEQDLGNKNLKLVTILDNHYPRQFKAAFKPPFVLFYEGNLKLLEKPLIAVSMNHKALPHVEPVIAKSIVEITKNHIIVNPLKSKQDQLILEQFNQNKKPMIVVNTSSIDQAKANNHNLILSEYPPHSKTANTNKPNRLVAALAENLILFNSSEQNHNNLVSAFLNQGKEVYCFPEIENRKSNNNKLISQGANVITAVKDAISNSIELERGR